MTKKQITQQEAASDCSLHAAYPLEIIIYRKILSMQHCKTKQKSNEKVQIKKTKTKKKQLKNDFRELTHYDKQCI